MINKLTMHHDRYRIGGTTELNRKNINKELLHGMGRWVKESWNKYISLDPEERAFWAVEVGKVYE